jgi:hypothetical protein
LCTISALKLTGISNFSTVQAILQQPCALSKARKGLRLARLKHSLAMSKLITAEETAAVAKLCGGWTLENLPADACDPRWVDVMNNGGLPLLELARLKKICLARDQLPIFCIDLDNCIAVRSKETLPVSERIMCLFSGRYKSMNDRFSSHAYEGRPLTFTHRGTTTYVMHFRRGLHYFLTSLLAIGRCVICTDACFAYASRVCNFLRAQVSVGDISVACFRKTDKKQYYGRVIFRLDDKPSRWAVPGDVLPIPRLDQEGASSDLELFRIMFSLPNVFKTFDPFCLSSVGRAKDLPGDVLQRVFTYLAAASAPPRLRRCSRLLLCRTHVLPGTRCQTCILRKSAYKDKGLLS